jgi:(p)ppGpp synthase/HD superfamily hydrolase
VHQPGAYASLFLMAAASAFPSFVDELPITRSALEFAAQQHRGQRREADHAPFILHPLEVAQLLRGRGYPDAVVAAGVLHDVIEDTGVAAAELDHRFGARVAALVTAVSEPSVSGSYPERKARLRDSIAAADADAVAVFAADKVAKVRELRMTLARRPGQVDADKLEHYWASLALLEHRLGHHPLVRQLRFELEALELLPPT